MCGEYTSENGLYRFEFNVRFIFFPFRIGNQNCATNGQLANNKFNIAKQSFSNVVNRSTWLAYRRLLSECEEI
jgi:hypothetical protein